MFDIWAIVLAPVFVPPAMRVFSLLSLPLGRLCRVVAALPTPMRVGAKRLLRERIWGHILQSAVRPFAVVVFPPGVQYLLSIGHRQAIPLTAAKACNGTSS